MTDAWLWCLILIGLPAGLVLVVLCITYIFDWITYWSKEKRAKESQEFLSRLMRAECDQKLKDEEEDFKRMMGVGLSERRWGPYDKEEWDREVRATYYKNQSEKK